MPLQDRNLQQKTDEDLVAATAWAAVDLIPGVEGGSISMIAGDKNITLQIATSEMPDHIDPDGSFGVSVTKESAHLKLTSRRRG